jgi:hypothetical protein
MSTFVVVVVVGVVVGPSSVPSIQSVPRFLLLCAAQCSPVHKQPERIAKLAIADFVARAIQLLAVKYIIGYNRKYITS